MNQVGGYTSVRTVVSFVGEIPRARVEVMTKIHGDGTFVALTIPTGQGEVCFILDNLAAVISLIRDLEAGVQFSPVEVQR